MKMENPAGTEKVGEESDTASQDEIEKRECDSESEQAGDELSSDEVEPDADTELYLARDKITKWNKKPPRKSRRVSSYNIVSHLPGVKGCAKNAKLLLNVGVIYSLMRFLKLLSNSQTNRSTPSSTNSLERDIRHTDLMELKALIGLLYLAGVYNANC